MSCKIVDEIKTAVKHYPLFLTLIYIKNPCVENRNESLLPSLGNKGAWSPESLPIDYFICAFFLLSSICFILGSVDLDKYSGKIFIFYIFKKCKKYTSAIILYIKSLKAFIHQKVLGWMFY